MRFGLRRGLSGADEARLVTYGEILREEAVALERQAAPQGPLRPADPDKDAATEPVPKKGSGESNDPDPQE